MNIDPLTTGFQAPKSSTSVPKVALDQPISTMEPQTSPNKSLSESKNKDDSTGLTLTPEKLQQEVNKLFEEQKTNLSLNFDLEQNGTIRSVQLLDPKTKEVVMQFPSEAVLQVRKNLEKMLQEKTSNAVSGFFLSEKT